MPLKGFMGDIAQPMGNITMSILSGKAPRTLAIMANILVVKAPFLYSAILGCPTLNNLRAMTSTYHHKMKFPIDLGVGKVCSEQVLAEECYAQELK